MLGIACKNLSSTDVARRPTGYSPIGREWRVARKLRVSPALVCQKLKSSPSKASESR